MNSLGRKNDDNGKNESIVFTKETLGVVLILFATLCLICLITRDVIFSVPGQAINAFLLGCFGYFSYVLCVYAILIGVGMLVDKKSKISAKSKGLIWSFITLVILLAHVISMRDYASLSYGEYLSKSYQMASGGVSCSSGGGIVFGLVAYLFSALLTNVGSYVIISVLIAVNVYGLVRIYQKSGKPETEKNENKFRSSYVAPKPDDVGMETRDYPVEGVDFSAIPEEKSVQKLFVNNAKDFGFKTRRDIKNEAKTEGIKLHGSGGLNVGNPSASYSSAYGEDMQQKINYIKTPAKIDIDKAINKDYGATRVSSPIPRTEPERAFEPDIQEIPFFEHDETPVDKEEDSAKSRAESFSGRYAEIEDLGGDRALPHAEPAETEKPVEKPQTSVNPFTSARAETSRSFTSDRTDINRTFVNSSEPFDIRKTEKEEIPFIPETGDAPTDAHEEEYRSVEESSVRSFEQPAEESEPTPSPINNDRRVRRILFGDGEKSEEVKPAVSASPAFTSRVAADSNSRSNLFTTEPVKEEVKKPAVPINRKYHKPPLDLLETYAPPADLPKENHAERMEIIKQTLADFHINAEPQSYVQGPSITRYEVMMPAGISVKRVLGLSEDLQMRLAVEYGVRIQAPIPGKNLIGIEVANSSKVVVGLKEVLMGMAGKKIKPESLTFAIGKDIVGDAICDDLAKGPHYLVAGATGAGKSVCLNTLLVSLVMRYSPEELKLILVDPKRVEFRVYEHLPHLMIDEIITDPKKVLAVLNWLVEEMERRYAMFESSGSLIDNIEAYNTNVASDVVPKMPRIVLIIDELADLMSHIKKDLEARIQILTQKARAAGIHLVLATQRPSVNVITGVIKTNLPSRIAFKVTNFQDSQTILDKAGAEKLLGYGDMLYKNSVMPDSERYQGAFISKTEVSNVVNYIIEHNKAYFDDELADYLEKAVHPKQEESALSDGEEGGENGENNELFTRALALAINSGTISISQLQRRFQIGYARAGGLVDKMERLGYISGNEGSKARRVLLTREEFEQKFGDMPD